MITERTLKKWRREALIYPTLSTMTDLSKENDELRRRIIKLTQELSDLILTTYVKKEGAGFCIRCPEGGVVKG